MTTEIKLAKVGKLTWLASYPKSGNTWMRLLVGNYLTGGDHINYLPKEVSESDLRDYDYHRHAPLPLAVMDLPSILALRPAVLEHKRVLAWHLLKTHHARIRTDGLDLIPTRVTDRAVYIVRNPINVAPSLATHIHRDNDRACELMADPKGLIRANDSPNLAHLLMDWSSHVESWRRAGRDDFPVHFVRYEDMKEDPGRELTAVLEFLGFDVDPERVKSAVWATDQSRIREREKTEKFFDTNKKHDSFFNREHEPMKPRHIEKIKRDQGEMMKIWGYISDGD